MYELETKAMINAAPEYISTLIGTDYIHCVVEDKTLTGNMRPIAWTDFDEKRKRWVVHFNPLAYGLSPKAKFALWRHEVGHIFFAHFGKEDCNPDDPYRSFIEKLQVGDLQINYYLLDDKPSMLEIGKLAKSLMASGDEGTEEVDGPGFLDPSVIYPQVGLNLQEYPYEIIHAYVHQKMDENDQEQGVENWSHGMCGGIEAPGKGSSMAEASAAVISGVMQEGEKKLGNTSFGSDPGLGEIRLRENELPEWVQTVETFARSIVEVVLADRRSHSRPQEVYKRYGIHVPTQRPRWSYKPDQVCLLVDTSGSMGDELKYVFPVIQYMNQHEISVRLIAGDTQVTMDEVFKPGGKLPEFVTGGGGTEITPLFDRAEDYSPRAIVCFSDGYVPHWPNDPEVPALIVGCQTEVPSWAQKA